MGYRQIFDENEAGLGVSVGSGGGCGAQRVFDVGRWEAGVGAGGAVGVGRWNAGVGVGVGCPVGASARGGACWLIGRVCRVERMSKKGGLGGRLIGRGCSLI